MLVYAVALGLLSGGHTGWAWFVGVAGLAVVAAQTVLHEAAPAQSPERGPGAPKRDPPLAPTGTPGPRGWPTMTAGAEVGPRPWRPDRGLMSEERGTPRRGHRSRRGLRRPRTGTVLATVVAVACGRAHFYAATRDPGYTTERVTPNDGAVWVTNDRGGLYGRLSKPSQSLDVAFSSVDTTVQTHQLDIIQAGATVVARDRVVGKLTPVDVRTGELVKDKSVAIATDERVAVGGGTVATLDPQTGELRAASAPADSRPRSTGCPRTPRPSPRSSSPRASPSPTAEPPSRWAPTGRPTPRAPAGTSPRPDHGTGRFTVRTTALGAALQDVQVGGRSRRPRRRHRGRDDDPAQRQAGDSCPPRRAAGCSRPAT